MLPELKTPLAKKKVSIDGVGRNQPALLPADRGVQAVTGFPLVLNTSFKENEPVMCAPHEALDCFVRTRMDVLVLDEVTRHTGAAPDEPVAAFQSAQSEAGP